MQQHLVWSAVALLLACSKSDKGEPKTKETPKDAAVAGSGSASGAGSAAEPATPALPKFDLSERLTGIGNNFNDTMALAVKKGRDEANAHCAELAPLFRTSCSSGIAAAYMAKKGASAKEFEATMAKLDASAGAVQCQALGFAVEDAPKVPSIARDLATDGCRANFWEGQGNQRAIAAAGAETAVCRKEEGKPNPDACEKQSQAYASADLVGTTCTTGKSKAKAPIPAGMETSCAHGVGQGLVFLFTDPSQAVVACGGKTQQLVDACISGAAYVTTVSAPDRVDVGFDIHGRLAPPRQAAFARGMGRALSFWKRRDDKSLTAWLAAVPQPQRQQAERLIATHDKCTSYFELDKCEWSK